MIGVLFDRLARVSARFLWTLAALALVTLALVVYAVISGARRR